jgi:hypothetical protein
LTWNPIYIWGILIMKEIFFSLLLPSTPLRSKHSPQHHVPKLIHTVYALPLTIWSIIFSQIQSYYLREIYRVSRVNTYP